MSVLTRQNHAGFFAFLILPVPRQNCKGVDNMKQPERVAELLAELRALTETDFERHRIDVLERDLTAPPVVEVIDDKHQRFNDVTYHKDKTGHYIKGSYLHRVVFQYYYDEMPSPLVYDIHHVDWNPDNNQPSNLQKLTRSEHHAIHSVKHGKYVRTKQVCLNCGATFSAKTPDNVYCSRDCYTEATKIAGKICPVCGKTFIPTQPTTCCSKSCAAKLRLQNTDAEEKTCPICGTKFVPISKQTLYCSQECYKKAQQKVCTCVICGKEFLNKSHANVSTCSPACAGKLRWQRRKSNIQ